MKAAVSFISVLADEDFDPESPFEDNCVEDPNFRPTHDERTDFLIELSKDAVTSLKQLNRLEYIRTLSTPWTGRKQGKI